ncbi:NIM1-INTERACTING 1-like [Olea europaea subsp. europaea]|uniref:NIM1-INTERACTING 1-like n=1 Tax=Olea europaea subsp. europaea TaxID=158383 RepID=A0A8S0T091_OLEEU|nr:NIM1-INTERACTING 1-like [Olea europaea subsp. europaea]
MDGERKKRKMENMENDDEKMESFFALIKSTRDIRQSMMKGRDQSNKKDSVKPIDDKPPPSPVVAWNPSFQPEDFMDDPQKMPLNHTAQLPAGSSSKREKEEEPRDEDQGREMGMGLDLNLSL